MNVSYCKCSYCLSATQDEAYRLKTSNFATVRVEIMGGAVAAGEVPTPPTYYTATICKECLNKGAASPIKPILDVMNTAKANDAEMIAAINA